MHFFIDYSAAPAEEETYYRDTPNYLELQKHSVDPPGVSYTYVMAAGNHAFMVATCLANVLGSWTPLLSHPKLGAEYLRFMQSNLPATGQLVANGLTGRYSRGALLNVPDPDSGDPVWLLTTYVGNIDLGKYESISNLLLNDRFMNAYVTVIAGAFDVCREVGSVQRPTFGSQARLFLGSFKSDAIDVGRLTFDSLPTLVQVARMGSGGGA